MGNEVEVAVEKGGRRLVVFSASWEGAEAEATFHAYRTYRSPQYGWKTAALAHGRMDVGDVLAEASRAQRAGAEVFCGAVASVELF